MYQLFIKKRNQKENNKAIIVDIASPWDHRVHEKEGEKIEKYQDLKRYYYYYYYFYYYYYYYYALEGCVLNP